MPTAPPPTPTQLAAISDALVLGGSIRLGPRLVGGLDNTMDVLDATDADGSTQRLVLRRYSQYRSSLDVLPRELAALHIATRGDVPAPKAVWHDETGIFDQPALVISYIDGQVDLLPKDPLDWADQMAQALARIHACSFNSTERAVLRDFHADLIDGINVAEVPPKFANHPLGEALWARIRDQLREYESPQPIFLHCDYHPGQVLWNDNRLVGVVDWQDAGYGDPISDVAYFICDFHYTGYPGAADRFAATYRSITGRPMDSLPFWTLVALSRPFPDIAKWAPSWHAVGRADLTVELLRQRHLELVQQALRNT